MLNRLFQPMWTGGRLTSTRNRLLSPVSRSLRGLLCRPHTKARRSVFLMYDWCPVRFAVLAMLAYSVTLALLARPRIALHGNPFASLREKSAGTSLWAETKKRAEARFLVLMPSQARGARHVGRTRSHSLRSRDPASPCMATLSSPFAKRPQGRFSGHKEKTRRSAFSCIGAESSSRCSPCWQDSVTLAPLARPRIALHGNPFESLREKSAGTSLWAPNKKAAFAACLFGAQEGTRTPTVLPPLGPEPSASTNSATWAAFCTALMNVSGMARSSVLQFSYARNTQVRLGLTA